MFLWNHSLIPRMKCCHYQFQSCILHSDPKQELHLANEFAIGRMEFFAVHTASSNDDAVECCRTFDLSFADGLDRCCFTCCYYLWCRCLHSMYKTNVAMYSTESWMTMMDGLELSGLTHLDIFCCHCSPPLFYWMRMILIYATTEIASILFRYFSAAVIGNSQPHENEESLAKISKILSTYYRQHLHH